MVALETLSNSRLKPCILSMKKSLRLSTSWANELRPVASAGQIFAWVLFLQRQLRSVERQTDAFDWCH